jgi:hypothetical protein
MNRVLEIDTLVVNKYIIGIKADHCNSNNNSKLLRTMMWKVLKEGFILIKVSMQM